MRRPIARRDGNHDAIKSDFENMGCTVIDTHATGIPGFPDLVVGCLGVNHLVDVKDPLTAYGRAGLNENQSAFQQHWNGGPIFVAMCTDDVVDLVHTWRAHVAKVITP